MPAINPALLLGGAVAAWLLLRPSGGSWGSTTPGAIRQRTQQSLQSGGSGLSTLQSLLPWLQQTTGTARTLYSVVRSVLDSGNEAQASALANSLVTRGPETIAGQFSDRLRDVLYVDPGSGAEFTGEFLGIPEGVFEEVVSGEFVGVPEWLDVPAGEFIGWPEFEVVADIPAGEFIGWPDLGSGAWEVAAEVPFDLGAEVGAEVVAEVGAEVGAEIAAEVGVEVGAEVIGSVAGVAASMVLAWAGASYALIRVSEFVSNYFDLTGERAKYQERVGKVQDAGATVQEVVRRLEAAATREALAATLRAPIVGSPSLGGMLRTMAQANLSGAYAGDPWGWWPDATLAPALDLLERLGIAPAEYDRGDLNHVGTLVKWTGARLDDPDNLTWAPTTYGKHTWGAILRGLAAVARSLDPSLGSGVRLLTVEQLDGLALDVLARGFFYWPAPGAGLTPAGGLRPDVAWEDMERLVYGASMWADWQRAALDWTLRRRWARTYDDVLAGLVARMAEFHTTYGPNMQPAPGTWAPIYYDPGDPEHRATPLVQTARGWALPIYTDSGLDYQPWAEWQATQALANVSTP